MIFTSIRNNFLFVVLTLAFNFIIPAASAAESNEKVYARVNAGWPDIIKIQEASFDKLTSGKYDQVIGEFDRYAQKNGHWTAYFSISNTTWTIFPEDSYRWMKIAEQKSDQHPLVMLELAMHYMRQEDCVHANQAWAIVEKSGDLKDYLRYLAAYCHIKTGDDAKAMKLLENPTGSTRNLGNTLGEIWDEPYLLARLSKKYQLLETLDNAQLQQFISQLMLNASNKATHPMLKAALSRLKKTSPDDDLFSQQAQCLSPWFLTPEESSDDLYYQMAEKTNTQGSGKLGEIRKKKADGLKAALDKCGLLTGKGGLPKDNDIARQLLQKMIDLELDTPKQLLLRFGPDLKSRANSAAGDLGALEILAALQVRAEDKAGLAESDELGWKRYHSARFAKSRVVGAMLALQPSTTDANKTELLKLDAASSALLTQAATEFPNEAMLLNLQLKYQTLDRQQRLDVLRRLVTAEYHLDAGAPRDIHFSRSAYDLMAALLAYQKLLQQK